MANEQKMVNEQVQVSEQKQVSEQALVIEQVQVDEQNQVNEQENVFERYDFLYGNFTDNDFRKLVASNGQAFLDGQLFPVVRIMAMNRRPINSRIAAKEMPSNYDMVCYLVRQGMTMKEIVDDLAGHVGMRLNRIIQLPAGEERTRYLQTTIQHRIVDLTRKMNQWLIHIEPHDDDKHDDLRAAPVNKLDKLAASQWAVQSHGDGNHPENSRQVVRRALEKVTADTKEGRQAAAFVLQYACHYKPSQLADTLQSRDYQTLYNDVVFQADQMGIGKQECEVFRVFDYVHFRKEIAYGTAEDAAKRIGGLANAYKKALVLTRRAMEQTADQEMGHRAAAYLLCVCCGYKSSQLASLLQRRSYKAISDSVLSRMDQMGIEDKAAEAFETYDYEELRKLVFAKGSVKDAAAEIDELAAAYKEALAKKTVLN